MLQTYNYFVGDDRMFVDSIHLKGMNFGWSCFDYVVFGSIAKVFTYLDIFGQLQFADFGIIERVRETGI